MARDARKVTEKQIRNAQNGSQNYLDGVESVDMAPGQKAIKKKAKYLANVQASVDKWERNTGAVTLEEWKKMAREKGGARFSSGVEAARDKILAFHEEFQPFVAGIKAKLDTMDDTTPEQRERKMVENVREMRKFKRTRRR